MGVLAYRCEKKRYKGLTLLGAQRNASRLLIPAYAYPYPKTITEVFFKIVPYLYLIFMKRKLHVLSTVVVVETTLCRE